MKIFILLTLFTLFTSCLPEQSVREQVGTTGSSTIDNSDELENGEGFFGTNITWLNSGVSSETVTVNISNNKSVYLVGDQLHNFLLSTDNFKSTYCLEVKFPQSANTSPKSMRIKVVPNFSNNFNQGQTTRFFFVNLGSETGNNFCDKDTIEIINGKDETVPKNSSNYVYKTSDVCSNCNGIIESSEANLYIYESSSNALKRVDTTVLDYSSLSLRIDTNSNSDSGQNSCSDSECVSLGFNCCQNGQCIKEKEIKMSGINADPTGFAIAEQEKLTNENWYKKYDQFYYACLELPPDDDIDPTPPDPEDPVGDADDLHKALLADYECIEELKANSLSDPFHANPINGSATYTKCDIVSSASTNYYKTVMKNIYLNCGCAEKDDLNAMVANCPAYTYIPVYETDNLGNQTTTIQSLVCKTPVPDNTDLPFQNLEVIVNSKSAPHRYFDINNIEINPFESIPAGVSGVQEGEEFQYLDDAYIFPKNGSFNMNSIIGQMNVQLSKAYPAYKIKIDFDKQYLIGTKSGYFQACPTCAKDSWFNNFSAFPFGNMGVGAQAVGFTTRRDTYVSNTTFGNYEDTIFNRACFLPPTMIPFGHSSNADNQTQRLNRLEAQAALFINGYQRDWYGFNKGALIGSFDGVTWFAIGKGRIAKSTSDTLYLAINAPFADLTSPTNHIVSVQEYDFSSTAAVYDYDPNQPINSAIQNEAGSCQQWHECDTDSHCITKLGWEYVCADVSYNKTNWPQFDVNSASEIAGTSRSGTIAEFLQQGSLPPGSRSKKCVYRGAGSPCRVDYENITDEQLRKTLTCAPNFYCASLSNSNAFNEEVSRFGRPLDELIESKNHIYGQDANILGRPKHYMSTGNLVGLPTATQLVIAENLLLTDSSGAGNFGLCRPGKLLPSYDSITTTKDWEPSNQHKANDPNYRTDFISQIAGCNSTLYTDLRYSSCPMLDESGNYINTQDDFLNDNFIIPEIGTPQARQLVTERYSFAQNSCGLESLSSAALPTMTSTGSDLKNFSAFKTIEASALSSSNTIIQQSIARDSCLRKAGAVCHTDLDCSPNRLQASVIDLVSADHFGNNAEKKYYEEYLVCGQARTEPSHTDSDFSSYNIHNNRCCRPVGETLTMFTEDSPSVSALDSIGIDTSVYGSMNPTATNRYSRYSVVDSTINALTKKSNIIRPSANSLDANNNKSIDNSVNITNQNQWKTIHTAASKTCCGGSWVRKFEDGSNDWSKKRLSINPNNFKCINNRSNLYLSEDATAYGMTQSQLEKDKLDFCYDPAQQNAGCIQQPIAAINDNFTIKKPTLDTTTVKMKLDSSFVFMNSNNVWENNPWTFDYFIPYDGSENTPDIGFVLPWSNIDPTEPTEMAAARSNIITRIPTFITYDNIAELNVRLTRPIPSNPSNLNAEISCVDTAIVNFDCGAGGNGGLCGEADVWTGGSCAGDGNPATLDCCFVYDPLTRALRVGFSNDSRLDPTFFGEGDSSLIVDFTAVGTLAWEQKKAFATNVSDPLMIPHRRSSKPGNEMYYLSKLAKLEYLGIPQMTYEPIYCNDNYQNLVPGIFKETVFGQSLKTVMDFLNHDRTFSDSGVSDTWNNDSAPAPYNANSLNQNLVGTQELIDHSPIFSDNQFKCCMELGTVIDENDSSAMCCSGTAIKDPTNETKQICKLPSGTDLNVYFNKFVSGEGLSSSIDTPLVEDDFDAKTGEPKTTSAILIKLKALGQTFCESGTTRRGGVFGSFQGQPGSSRPNVGAGGNGSFEGFIYSITDDQNDLDQDSSPQTGYNSYDDGFRWNHHIYCNNEGI